MRICDSFLMVMVEEEDYMSKEKTNYREFKNANEVNEWAYKYYGNFLNETSTEIYNKVFEYTGSFYTSINSFMRKAPDINSISFDSWWPDHKQDNQKLHDATAVEGLTKGDFSYIQEDIDDDRASYTEIKTSIKMINNLLMSYKLNENIVAYRIVPLNYLKIHTGARIPKKNSVIRDKAFISTSLLFSGIKDLFHKRSGYKAILKISIPKRTCGAYVSQDGYQNNKLREYEFLLPPNTDLCIKHVHYLTYPMLIECEVISKEK